MMNDDENEIIQFVNNTSGCGEANVYASGRNCLCSEIAVTLLEIDSITLHQLDYYKYQSTEQFVVRI
jgi:hypothetical protein